MSKKISSFLVAGAAWLLVGQACAQESLLSGYLDRMLSTHPAIRAKELSQQSADQLVTFAWMQFLPTPSVAVDKGPANTPANGGGNRASTYRISQPIWMGVGFGNVVASTVTQAEVNALNLQLAKLLGLSTTTDITNILPTFVVDASGNLTLSATGKYGQLLAQISDQAVVNSTSMDSVQTTLASAITWAWNGTTGTATASADMVKQVILLAKVAQAAALNTGTASGTYGAYLSDTDLSNYGITGVSGLSAARKADMLQRIVDSADDASAYDTITELQALANKVVALAKIQDYANSSTNPAPTLADYTDAGVANVTASNVTAINAKLLSASTIKGTVPNDLSIQTAVNTWVSAALKVITDYAISPTNTTPSLSHYAMAGVAKVTADNLAAVNAKIDADNTLGSSSTLTDVQADVTAAVNAYDAAFIVLRSYMRDAQANPAPGAATYAALGLSQIDTIDEMASANYCLTQVLTSAKADDTEKNILDRIKAQYAALITINDYAVDNANTAPKLADYVAAGVPLAIASSANKGQLDSTVDAQTSIANAKTLVDLLTAAVGVSGTPTLSSIVCAGSSVANGSFQSDAYLNAAELGAGQSANFTVTFDRAVTGIHADGSNFSLTDTGGNALTGSSGFVPTLAVVSADGGAGKLWTVTASGLTGLSSTFVRLNLANNTGIVDANSSNALATTSYTGGQSYTVDTTNAPTLAAATGQDLTLNSGETSVDLYVDPANLTVGDTLKLTTAGGTQLGSITVTTAHLSTGVTFNVLKTALSNGNNVLTLTSTDVAGNPATTTATVNVGEYVQVTGILGLPSKVLAGNDLKVTAYDANNNVLGTGTIDATNNTYSLQLLKTTTGLVKIQLASNGSAKDYYDEANAAQADLGSMAINATISADGTAKTANLTLLSDVAARLIAGITTPTAAQISAANLAVTKLFINASATAEITAYTPDFGITNTGTYNSGVTIYGQLLNQLSQQALVQNRALDVVLKDLAAGINYNSTTGVATLNSAFAHEVFMLAKTQMPGRSAARSRALPKVMVAVESQDTLACLQQQGATWGFPVSLQFVDSVTEALLTLGSERPDLLVAELSMTKAQQDKTLQALENFNARSRPISMVLVTQENQLQMTSSQSASPIQLAPGPLSDVWLHAYLTGVVATCRT